MAIKVFIDQGHNPYGVNAGAEGHGLREQDITYMVGSHLENLFMNDSRFDTKTSRTTPTQVLGYNNTSSLRERANGANTWPADYFISIHVNANNNPEINGTEVYVLKEFSETYYLGEYIIDEITKRTGAKDNGVRINPSLYVLMNTNMPSLLIELGYITNYNDAIKMRDNAYQFAYGIYMGLLHFFEF